MVFANFRNGVLLLTRFLTKWRCFNPGNSVEVLTNTNLNFLGSKKVGKVRDIYDRGDKLILITTDRHSSFDRIIAHIPWKGQVLNQVSAWWFDKTRDIISNHVFATPDPNVTVAKKFKMVPVEAVVRGYLTGVTDTSIWTRYLAGKRDFGEFTLPDGMKNRIFGKSSKLCPFEYRFVPCPFLIPIFSF